MKKPAASPLPNRIRSGIAAWFQARLDLAPALAFLAKKTVPVHRHSWIYLLGGAALFLFGLQVVTGALLMLYYQPAENTAYESIQGLMQDVPSGWLIRSVHVWGASLFIAVAGLHLLVKLFSRAYRKPREMTWISGTLLLFLALASGFSGYLLPWNELSYYATRVGTDMPGMLPLVGDGIVHLLRGGSQVTGDTITRFYAAHVLLLPLGYGLILAVHLGLIQVQGMSLPLGMSEKDVRDHKPFFAEFVLIDACGWLVLFGIIATLAVLVPAEMGVKADPLQPAPEGIKPEWYFLFVFQTLKYLPELVGISLFGLLAILLPLIPFLDRWSARQQRNRWLTALFLLLIGWAVALEAIAIAAPGPEHPPEPPAVGTLSRAHATVSLVFLWGVIGFLVFYLWQLAGENARVRKLYHHE